MGAALTLCKSLLRLRRLRGGLLPGNRDWGHLKMTGWYSNPSQGKSLI